METPSPSPPPAPSSPLLRPRGRAETRLRPPSFTSALTGIKTPPPPPVPLLPEILDPPSTKQEDAEEVKSEPIEQKKSTMSKSRSSPPKDEMTKSQKWNDGSVERLAEKWAAKRDTLLRETGVMAENLQQRKVAMEQRLESVKRSIPKRSIGFTPQSAQKRLSLCETFVKTKVESPTKEEVPKRKSLDIDIVVPPDAEDSDPEDSPLTKKLNEIRRGSPQRMSDSPRKPSPELGSSDSDDSLPPYPTEARLDLDQPLLLPPPPPVCEPLPVAPSLTVKPSSKLEKSTPSIPNGLPRQSLLSSRSSLVTYKTVSAPLTSVAVSRTLPAPQRSIADSPRLPFKKLPENTESPVQTNPVEKVPVPDEKTPQELEIPEHPNDKTSNSVGARREVRAGPGVSRVRRIPHSSAELAAAPTKLAAGIAKPDQANSSDLSAPSNSGRN